MHTPIPNNLLPRNTPLHNVRPEPTNPRGAVENHNNAQQAPTDLILIDNFTLDQGIVDTEMPGSSQTNNDIVFHAIDPPVNRPSRNPVPIDRLSYPQSHVKDQRTKYLKKYQRRRR